MRVIKLSQEEPIGFATLAGVQSFFRGEISQGKPFLVTPGRIAQDAFTPGERLVFAYQGRVVFTAQAGTGLLRNEGDERQTYPMYFLVDPATLRDADKGLDLVEQWYYE